jgi:putative ATPase
MPEKQLQQRTLTERMRPTRHDDFVGQEHLAGLGNLLKKLVENGRIPPLLLWGPPGSGKTTLAAILAHAISAHFVFFSAVLSGVKEMRQIIDQAKTRREQSPTPTILFVDEIHRFNKSQGDALLPHVENGLLTLIGATTDNPSFQITAPLLSRCQAVLFLPLLQEDIKRVILQALVDPTAVLGEHHLTIVKKALKLLTEAADGDCRRALNHLETAAHSGWIHSVGNPRPQKKNALLPWTVCWKCCSKKSCATKPKVSLISALHKSSRDSDPDGTAYWLDRMLTIGEDPMYIARRMICFTSEDISNTDPLALQVALNCREAYHMRGFRREEWP